MSLDGWVTTVVQRHNFVVTCGPSTASGFDSTFAEALTAANRGLDYMSVRGQADCAIRDATDDCLVWWPDSALGGTVMRCRAIQTMGFTLSATATARDAAGNVLPSPPPPTAMANDVFRFVRMCRTSDDLFDSYRNLFLAFECLLSDIRPRQRKPRRWPGFRRIKANGRWESEKRWFMDALSEADQLVPLSSLTPQGIQNHGRWIYRWIYSAQRSALVHAKQGQNQNYLLPQDESRRAELIASLGKLSDYTKKLIEKHLGVTHLTSHLTLYAVEKMAKGVLPQFAMVVSDDDSGPLNPQGENPIAQGSTVVELHPSTPAADLDDPELWTLLAHRDTADLARLTAIRRFGLKEVDGDGSSHVLSELVGPLSLGSAVIRLEMVNGYRHVNPSGAPRQFSS